MLTYRLKDLTWSFASARQSSFMIDVSMHIVEGHLIHRELVRIQEAKDNKANPMDGTVVSFMPLQYPSTHECSHLQCFTSISNFPSKVAKMPCILFYNDLGCFGVSPVPMFPFSTPMN